MRVARLHAVSDLRLADEPVPIAEPGTSLVRVTAVGICGSDLHWWTAVGIGDAKLDQPLVLGHEAAGSSRMRPDRAAAPQPTAGRAARWRPRKRRRRRCARRAAR